MPEIVCLSVCSLLNRHVWGLTFCRRAPGPMVIARTLKTVESPRGWGTYVDQVTPIIIVRSYVQLFAGLCVFSTIVPSYVTYVPSYSTDVS